MGGRPSRWRGGSMIGAGAQSKLPGNAPLSVVAEGEHERPAALEAFLALPDERRRLGAFHLRRQLGRGGFAPVWLASEQYDGLEVRVAAIKLFAFEATRADAARVSRHRERIVREARTLCQVDHPNIVRFYAILTDDALPIAGLAMEYLDGASVAELLKRRKRLGVAETVGIGMAVAAALEAGHRAGIVHRDVKPANVMESQTGYKLIDFGIATDDGAVVPRAPAEGPYALPDELPACLAGTKMTVLAGGASEVRSTAPGGVIAGGTLGYIDPACMAYGLEATPSSDLYSLGVLLFECLTGALPARIAGTDKLSGPVLDGRSPPGSVAELGEAVPPRLARLVDALLDSDRGRRPASAGDVVTELEAVATDLLALAPEAAAPGPARRRSRTVAVLVASAAIALAGIAMSRRPLPPALAAGATVPAVSEPGPSRAGPPAPEVRAAVVPSRVRGSVAVAPHVVVVSVDGVRRGPDASGVLVLEGEPGAVFRLTVVSHGHTRTETVVLSRDGRASPERIGPVALMPRGERVRRVAPASAPPPAPSAAPPAGGVRPTLVPKDDF